MNRLPVFWVGRPDEDDEMDRPYIGFRFRDNWVAIDSDQLLAPVTLTERDGTNIEPVPGILKQYGGESLRADIMEAALENDIDGFEHTEWIIEYDDMMGFVASYVGEFAEAATDATDDTDETDE